MRSLLALIFATLLLACAGVPSSRESGSLETTTPAKKEKPDNREKALGKKFLQSALKDFQFVKDYEVVHLVNQVGKEIVEAAGENPESYHFFVVRQNQLNAFAIPGGYIFLFDGMLKKLDSVNALAGVLAHEIAHVEQKHFFKDAKKISAVNLATMASIILAGLAGEGQGATGTIAVAANVSMQLKFSRKNEEEADLHAIRFLKQTPYAPAGLSDFFKTLSFYQRFTRGIPPPYLSTHPGLSERSLMVEALTRDLPPGEKVPIDWERIATIMGAGEKGLPKQPASQSRQGKEQFRVERQFYLKGLSDFKSGRLKDALDAYQKAIKQNGNKAIYHADLSQIYMQLQEADLAGKAAEKSIALSDKIPTPHLVLGMISQSQDNHENAASHLERATAIAPDHAFIHLQLARSYHALKKEAKERFHLGRHHRLNLEPVLAMKQFQKGLALLKEEGALFRKIQSEMRGIKREGI